MDINEKAIGLEMLEYCIKAISDICKTNYSKKNETLKNIEFSKNENNEIFATLTYNNESSINVDTGIFDNNLENIEVLSKITVKDGQLIYDGNSIYTPKASTTDGNILVVEEDNSLFVPALDINISENEGNIISKLEDGIYASEIEISDEEDNILEKKDGKLFATNNISSVNNVSPDENKNINLSLDDIENGTTRKILDVENEKISEDYSGSEEKLVSSKYISDMFPNKLNVLDLLSVNSDGNLLFNNNEINSSENEEEEASEEDIKNTILDTIDMLNKLNELSFGMLEDKNYNDTILDSSNNDYVYINTNPSTINNPFTNTNSSTINNPFINVDSSTINSPFINADSSTISSFINDFYIKDTNE